MRIEHSQPWEKPGATLHLEPPTLGFVRIHTIMVVDDGSQDGYLAGYDYQRSSEMVKLASVDTIFMKVAIKTKGETLRKAQEILRRLPA